jgi:hypothetical protein
MSKYHTSDFKLTSKLGDSFKNASIKHSSSNKDLFFNSLWNSTGSSTTSFIDSDSEEYVTIDSYLGAKENGSCESTCSEDSFHPIVAFDIEMYNRPIIQDEEFSMFNVIYAGLDNINVENINKPRQFNA